MRQTASTVRPTQKNVGKWIGSDDANTMWPTQKNSARKIANTMRPERREMNELRELRVQLLLIGCVCCVFSIALTIWSYYGVQR
jgi:hypothetical protein